MPVPADPEGRNRWKHAHRTWIIENSKVRPALKRLLREINHHTRSSLDVFASATTLAKALGLAGSGKAHVCRYMRELQADFIISVRTRKRENGSDRSSLKRINDRSLLTEIAPCWPPTLRPSKRERPPPQFLAPALHRPFSGSASATPRWRMRHPALPEAPLNQLPYRRSPPASRSDP